MPSRGLRFAGGGCLGGLLGTFAGGAVPIAWFLVVEGGRGGPGAVVDMAYSLYAGIGAVVGAILGVAIGAGIAWAMTKSNDQAARNRAREVSSTDPDPASDRPCE